MAGEWQGNGTACVNQTRSHCVNQMGKTQSKPLAERHGMCESAFTLPYTRWLYAEIRYRTVVMLVSM
jgi:hypothetical protein